MIELPEFAPLHVTATSGPPTRAALDRVDHLLVVRRAARRRARSPAAGKQLATLLARATSNGDDFASSRAANRAPRDSRSTRSARRPFHRAHLGGEGAARMPARQAALARSHSLGSTPRPSAARPMPARGGRRGSIFVARVQGREKTAFATHEPAPSTRTARSISTQRARERSATTSRVGSRRCRPTCSRASAYRKAIERLAKARRIGRALLRANASSPSSAPARSSPSPGQRDARCRNHALALSAGRAARGAGSRSSARASCSIRAART